MSFAITRDSSFKLIKKIVSDSTKSKVGNVSLIGANTVELSSVLIGGSILSIDNSSLNYLNIQTIGNAENNKIVVLDSNRNVSGINEISVNELYINGKKVTGITNSGVSNSPYLNNIQPGYGSENKIISVDSNLGIKNINSISTNNIIENGGDIISTNYNIPLIDNSLSNIFTFVNRYVNTLIPYSSIPYHPVCMVKLGDYYICQQDILSVLNTNVEIGTTPYNTENIPLISDSLAAYYPMTLKNITYSSSLNLYACVYQLKSSNYISGDGFYYGFFVKKSSTLSGLRSTTASTIIYSRHNGSDGFVTSYSSIMWVPILNKFYAYCKRSGYIEIYASSNCINWTSISYNTPNIYAMFYTSNKLYICTATNYLTDITNRSVGIPNDFSINITLDLDTFNFSFPVLNSYFAMSSGKLAYSNNLSVWYLIPIILDDNSTFKPLHVEYSGSGTIFYINSYTGCCSFNSDTKEIICISKTKIYLDNKFITNSRNSGNKYTYEYNYTPSISPLNIVQKKIWNPSNYEFLDFKNMSYFIKDYTYSSELDCYYIIGRPLTSIGPQINDYIFYSKDFVDFVIILTLPNITYDGIYYSNDTNILFYFSSISTTYFYSINYGETWVSKSTPSGSIKEIYYDKLFNFYLIFTNTNVYYLYNLSDIISTLITSGSTTALYSYDKKFKILEQHLSTSTNTSIKVYDLENVLYGPSTLNSSVLIPTSTTVVISGNYSEMGFFENNLSGILFSNKTTNVFNLRISNNGYMISEIGFIPLPSSSAAKSWHKPIWIPNIKCFLTCSIGDNVSTNYNNFAYSNDGLNWNTVKGRYSLTAGKPLGLKYDDNNGHIYIFTSTVTMRSRYSLIKNNIMIENVLDDTFTNQLGYNTGYELTNFDTILGLPANSLNNWNSIAYGYGYYITCTTDKICYFDNINNQNNINISGNWKSVNYGNRAYAMCCSNKIAYSTNLTNWTNIDVTGLWESILYKNNKWIISSSDNKIAYSTNLTNWTIIDLTKPSANISYGNSYYLSCGLNNISYSLDLTTWVNINLIGNWKSILFGYDKYVVVGDTKMSYSSDLINWTTITTTQSLNGIIYIKDIKSYLVFGNNCVGYSNNLVKWNYKTISGNINSTIFSYRLGCTISVGDNNLLLSSNIIKVALDSTLTIPNNSIIKTVSGTSSFLAVGTSEAADGYLSVSGTNGDNAGIIYMKNKLDNSIAIIGSNDATTLKLEIDGFVNIQSYSSKSLFYLGQNILQTSATQLNYLYNLTSGNITSGNTAILLDSDGNTSGINEINVDKLIINNELYVPIVNDLKITSAIPGLSESNKVVITDVNNSISGIDKISTNTISIGNNNFTNCVSSVDILKMSYNYCANIGNSNSIVDIIYLESKKMYIALIDSPTFTTTIYGEKTYLLCSYDGINWFKKYTTINAYATQIFEKKITNNSNEIYLVCRTDVNSTNKIYKSSDLTYWSPTVITNRNLDSYYTAKTSIITVSDYGTCLINTAVSGAAKVLVGSLSATDIFNLFQSSNVDAYNVPNIFKGYMIHAANKSLCMLSTNNVYLVNGNLTSGRGTSNTLGYSIFDGIVIPNIINNTYIIITVGSGGNISYSNSLSNTSYVDFTLTTTNISSDVSFISVCYNEILNKILVIGNSGVNRIMICNDISNLSIWEPITENIITTSWNLCKSAGSKGFILSNIDSSNYKNNKISIIDNNNNFILSQVGYDYTYGNGIYAFGYFIIPIFQVTTVSIPKMIYSSDGFNWTPNKNISSLNQIYCISYSSKLNNAIAGNGNLIILSTDGINWSTVYTAAGGTIYTCKWISSLNMYIAMVKGLSINNVLKSIDGINWTTTTIPSTYIGDVEYSESVDTIVIIPTEDSFAGGVTMWYSLDKGNSFIESTSLTSWFDRPGKYLHWNTLRNCFKYVVNNAFTKANIISYDGINWEVSNFITTNTSIPSNLLTQFIFIDSLNAYVAVACSATLGPALVYTKNDINLNVLCYLDSLSSSTIEYEKIIYEKSINKILIYKKEQSVAFGDNFIIVDLEEYKYKINNELDLEELNNKYNINTPSSALQNWKKLSVTFPFTGKVKWIHSKGMFAAIAGADTITSGRQLIYSPDGYKWAFAINTLLTLDTCYDLEEIINTGDLILILNSTAKFAIYEDLKKFGAEATCVVNNLGVSSPKKIFYLKKYKIHVYTISVLSTKLYLLDYANSTNYTCTESIDLPSSIIVGCITYSPELDIFIILPSNATSTFFYGNNLINLSTGALNTENGGYESCAYSSLLQIFVAASSNGNIIYSTNGINWLLSNAESSTYSEIIWVDDLSLFIATSTTESISPIIYSNNGVDWTSIVLDTAESIYSIAWSPINGNFVMTAGLNKILVSVPVIAKPGNVIHKYTETALIESPTRPVRITTNNSESPGLIINPYYSDADDIQSATNENRQLVLQVAGAYKPTSSTWTISSDERIKENIELADLDICYNNIKNLPLKKYKWKDEYIELCKVEDHNKLGWIAQDVEQFYPKSIGISEILDIKDCKTLDTDQIISGLYGAIQKLCKKYKDLEEKLQ